MTKSEHRILDTIESRGFTWPTDKAHGLSVLQAKRAISGLERAARIRKTEALGAESYCAA
jgi:hypothetical protein